jgi:hypothetical protein
MYGQKTCSVYLSTDFMTVRAISGVIPFLLYYEMLHTNEFSLYIIYLE